MKVTRNKVNYSEVHVMMSLDEVQEVLAKHVRDTKNVPADAKNVEFCILTDDDNNPVVEGVTVTMIKRGRVQRNGRPVKEDEEEVIASEADEEEPTEEVEEAPKRKRGRPRKND